MVEGNVDLPEQRLDVMRAHELAAASLHMLMNSDIHSRYYNLVQVPEEVVCDMCKMPVSTKRGLNHLKKKHYLVMI